MAEAEAPAEKSTTVDVDAMTDDELNALVKEFGIETPKEWKTWMPTPSAPG